MSEEMSKESEQNKTKTNPTENDRVTVLFPRHAEKNRVASVQDSLSSFDHELRM
jgi:hypothetical protein